MIKATPSGFELIYGDLIIPFQVEPRTRKHLAITVFPEQRLQVLAPESAALEAVLARVEKRAVWIARQWRFFEDYQPQTHNLLYVSGETHRYLGRQYRLKVEESENEGVKLIGQFLYIQTKNRSDRERTRQLLEGWYRAHAQRVFAARLNACFTTVRSLQLEEIPPFTIRKMTKRWGSCTRCGHLLLNLELIKVPTLCIDYVIIHELCHLKIRSHGRAFYRLLSRVLPDWEARKKRLELTGF